MNTWTTREQLQRVVQLQQIALALAAKGSLMNFVTQAMPILEPNTPFVPGYHVELVCEYLEEVSAGRITRFVVNLPPRYLKSVVVSILWPLWEWLRCPGQRWLFVSHSEGLVTKLAADRRRIVQSPFYRALAPDWRLTSGQSARADFRNTAGGAMFAATVGSSIIGRGGNRIVVDDPHDPKHIESAGQREDVLHWFREQLITRLDDKALGAIVVAMQRLHTRDVSALCRELQFVVLAMAARAESRVILDFPRSKRQVIREVGDPLCAAREDAATLAQLERTMGAYAWASQCQQEPVSREGFILKRPFWRYYDTPPTDQSDRRQSWDLTFTGRATSDFVVGLVIVRVGANFYILDRCKARMSFTETKDAIRQFVARYPSRHVYIEKKANGDAVLDELRLDTPCILGVNPEGNKIQRALAATGPLEAGQVWLPQPYDADGRLIPGREWVLDFVDACTAFPGGPHDDDVDAFTQAIIQFRKEPERPPFLEFMKQQHDAMLAAQAPPPPPAPAPPPAAEVPASVSWSFDEWLKDPRNQKA